MTNKPADTSKKMTHTVSNYFTPLSIFLVGSGFIVSMPPSPKREFIIGLIVFSALLNMISFDWLGTSPEQRRKRVLLRVWLNTATNILLVYFFGFYWKPIWLLLLLSPMGSALYGTQMQTLATSYAALIALMVIQMLRPEAYSAARYAEQGAYGIFIVLICLALFKFTHGLHKPKV
ncbi:MAG: hypothetical protein ABIJ96_05440 [Elusimicrobiota bacterium]